MTIATPIATSASAIARHIGGWLNEIVAVRHDLHRHPEIAYEEHRTSARIAELLSAWGYEVTRDLTETGLVATLRAGSGPRRLAIRADIDALPITEASGLPFTSETPGLMHACGHDGHTAILLAAARYLAETRRFDGTLHLVFQPAEELGGGARAFIKAGLFERFPVDAIFGLHNWPGVDEGRFGIIEGPVMAAVDKVDVQVKGRGGHGAAPHETVDPVVAASHAIAALQSVVARNVDPQEMAVVTVGAIHGGDAANVIPDTVDLTLTLRSFSEATRTLLGERVPALIEGVVGGFGAEAKVRYSRGYPSVTNHAAEARFARDVAEDLFGPGRVIADFRPRTASEDFAYYLLERPGAFLFVGTGDGAPLHSPAYRFNDAIIEPAAVLWAGLTERYLAGDPAA